MDSENYQDRIGKNPSRQECEEQIRRTLMTEIFRHGNNEHFKTAKDFMPIFEALYPSGPGLTKQVQRAVKAMNMPKDERGCFIVDKTKEQQQQEQEISRLLKMSDSETKRLHDVGVLFLKTDCKYRDYLKTLVSECSGLKDKFITVIDSTDGLLFLTETPEELSATLNAFLS